MTQKDLSQEHRAGSILVYMIHLMNKVNPQTWSSQWIHKKIFDKVEDHFMIKTIKNRKIIKLLQTDKGDI